MIGWLRRRWRVLLGVDCAFCVAHEHATCELVWPSGCMCRVIEGHAGPMA